MIDVRDELNGLPGIDAGPYRTLVERIGPPRGALIYQTDDLTSIAKVREDAIALFTAKYRASQPTIKLTTKARGGIIV